jgi:hypothetical protein
MDLTYFSSAATTTDVSVTPSLCALFRAESQRSVGILSDRGIVSISTNPQLWTDSTHRIIVGIRCPKLCWHGIYAGRANREPSHISTVMRKGRVVVRVDNEAAPAGYKHTHRYALGRRALSTDYAGKEILGVPVTVVLVPGSPKKVGRILQRPQRCVFRECLELSHRYQPLHADAAVVEVLQQGAGRCSQVRRNLSQGVEIIRAQGAVGLPHELPRIRPVGSHGLLSGHVHFVPFARSVSTVWTFRRYAVKPILEQLLSTRPYGRAA